MPRVQVGAPTLATLGYCGILWSSRSRRSIPELGCTISQNLYSGHSGVDFVTRAFFGVCRSCRSCFPSSGVGFCYSGVAYSYSGVPRVQVGVPTLATLGRSGTPRSWVRALRSTQRPCVQTTYVISYSVISYFVIYNLQRPIL